MSYAAAPFSGRDLACVRGGRMVFAGLNFSLAPGAVLLLRGRNGSGKTSLLRMAAGLLPSAAGGFVWEDLDPPVDRATHHSRILYAGHAEAVKPALTVLENLVFWAALRGHSATACREALGRLGLAELADLPARFLSAGQRRRVNLARLFVSGAALWLLDEPATALDTATRDALDAAIGAHRDAGGMAIIATHGAPEVGPANEIDLDKFAGHDIGFTASFDPDWAEL